MIRKNKKKNVGISTGNNSELPGSTVPSEVIEEVPVSEIIGSEENNADLSDTDNMNEKPEADDTDIDPEVSDE